jgi:hypothetical protein
MAIKIEVITNPVIEGPEPGRRTISQGFWEAYRHYRKSVLPDQQDSFKNFVQSQFAPNNDKQHMWLVAREDDGTIVGTSILTVYRNYEAGVIGFHYGSKEAQKLLEQRAAEETAEYVLLRTGKTESSLIRDVLIPANMEPDYRSQFKRVNGISAESHMEYWQQLGYRPLSDVPVKLVVENETAQLDTRPRLFVKEITLDDNGDVKPLPTQPDSYKRKRLIDVMMRWFYGTPIGENTDADMYDVVTKYFEKKGMANAADAIREWVTFYSADSDTKPAPRAPDEYYSPDVKNLTGPLDAMALTGSKTPFERTPEAVARAEQLKDPAFRPKKGFLMESVFTLMGDEAGTPALIAQGLHEAERLFVPYVERDPKKLPPPPKNGETPYVQAILGITHRVYAEQRDATPLEKSNIAALILLGVCQAEEHHKGKIPLLSQFIGLLKAQGFEMGKNIPPSLRTEAETKAEPVTLHKDRFYVAPGGATAQGGWPVVADQTTVRHTGTTPSASSSEKSGQPTATEISSHIAFMGAQMRYMTPGQAHLQARRELAHREAEKLRRRAAEAALNQQLNKG